MKLNVLLAFVLSSLCSLCLCGESFASLDPELKTAYQLKVVLHFADNRLLTPVLCDRVERELRDGLQASFGDLVNVEVTRQDPRLNQVIQNGLKTLDGWRERSAVKTHFVLIDFSGVYYEIQARQFDGLTGRPSPVLRRDHTRDREFVAKTAALLIDQDFGLAGTFDVWPQEVKPGEDSPLTVNLKGGGLGAPLDRWIKKGDVFAVVQMPSGDGAPGTPVEGAMLQVETPPAGADSTCLCRPFRRYKAPASTSGGGFRCVKLGTISASLRLRLLQAFTLDRSGPLNEALSVQIRRRGFENEKALVKPTDNLDAVDTAGDGDGKFSNIAFVTVTSSEGKVRARIPVPILDDQPVVLAVNVSGDAGDGFAFSKAAWERDVANAWQEQNELFREKNEGPAKTETRADFMKRIEAERLRIQHEVETLSGQQAMLKVGAADQEMVDLLKQIKGGGVALKQSLDALKKIDEEENDPQKKEWKDGIEQGKQLEAAWELEKAIAKYAAMLKAGAPNDELKKGLETHLAELREEWKPKSEEHGQARAFIYNVWPALAGADLKDKLADAQKAFKVCKAVGDKAALYKLFNATKEHAVRMTEKLKKLRPDINIEDEKDAKVIQEASKGLRELAVEVNAALAAPAPAGK